VEVGSRRVCLTQSVEMGAFGGAFPSKVVGCLHGRNAQSEVDVMPSLAVLQTAHETSSGDMGQGEMTE
jgi:hypothetical protein